LIILASAALTAIGLAKVGSIDTLVSSVPQDFWMLFRPASDATYPWHAILLGYPVLGIWFWCTDQTIVQRVLGGRNLREGQYGAIFASAMKIITPLIFFVPGIICRVLHPGLEKADQAYMVMVTQHLPIGMVGLIIAVLIAALVTTLDAGLNSFSTVFTLNVYHRHLRKAATDKEIRRTGQITTGIVGLLGILCAIALGQVRMNLFELGQSMISFLAPSMAAVFLVGVLWRRATSAAALSVLIAGNIVSIAIGVCYLSKWPVDFSHTHFLLLSFYLFVTMCLVMFVVSMFTPPQKQKLPSLAETYRQLGAQNRMAWLLWALIAICMAGMYLFFN
jgi:SSS family solute:Na+ symporter